ncbi:unnamed protein product [Vicia faba]|uniref:Uncharacterized protein n=1 Tax=Vicia faba TaxID=3906 RepID=A0AAV0YJT4_VICFA|nr:unnamed protein product [Vicia faba]
MHVGEKEEFILKCNSLKSMFPSSNDAQVCSDEDKISGIGLKGWIPQLSCLKDAAYWVWKCVPHRYVNKNCGTEEKEKNNRNFLQLMAWNNGGQMMQNFGKSSIVENSKKEEFIMKFNSLKSMIPSSSEAQVCNNEGKISDVGLRGWIPQLSCLKDVAYWLWKCIPHQYVNKNCDIKE